MSDKGIDIPTVKVLCLGRIGIGNCADPDQMLLKEQSDQGIKCLSFTNYYIVIPNCFILGHLW